MHVCIYRTSRCLARHPYIGKMKSSFTTTLNVEKLTLLRMMYSLSPLSSGKFSSGMKCSFTTTLSVLLTSPPYIGKMSRNFLNSNKDLFLVSRFIILWWTSFMVWGMFFREPIQISKHPLLLLLISGMSFTGHLVRFFTTLVNSAHAAACVLEFMITQPLFCKAGV